MSSSEARVAANQRNGALSREPKTDAGKAEARRNALKHGLAGRGTVLPEEMQRKIEVRLASWSMLYRPEPGPQTWTFEQMVRASVAVQICQTEQLARMRYLMLRAATPQLWDIDQAAAVEALAERLSKKPARVVRQLRQTKHGVAWLLARWYALASSCCETSPLTAEQRTRALDLLGVPLEERSRDGLGAGDDSGPAALWAEIRAEIAELEALQEGLDELDGQRRAQAELGLGLSDDPELRLLRRYEAQHRRTFERAQLELRHCYYPPGTVAPTGPTALYDAQSPAASAAPAAPSGSPPKVAPGPNRSPEGPAAQEAPHPAPWTPPKPAAAHPSGGSTPPVRPESDSTCPKTDIDHPKTNIARPEIDTTRPEFETTPFPATPGPPLQRAKGEGLTAPIAQELMYVTVPSGALAGAFVTGSAGGGVAGPTALAQGPAAASPFVPPEGLMEATVGVGRRTLTEACAPILQAAAPPSDRRKKKRRR